MTGGLFSSVTLKAGLVLTKTRSAMTLASWVLKIIKDGDPTTSLDYLSHYPLEEAFTNIQSDPPQTHTLVFYSSFYHLPLLRRVRLHYLWNCLSGICRLLFSSFPHRSPNICSRSQNILAVPQGNPFQFPTIFLMGDQEFDTISRAAHQHQMEWDNNLPWPDCSIPPKAVQYVVHPIHNDSIFWVIFQIISTTTSKFFSLGVSHHCPACTAA